MFTKHKFRQNTNGYKAKTVMKHLLGLNTNCDKAQTVTKNKCYKTQNLCHKLWPNTNCDKVQIVISILVRTTQQHD